MYEPQRQPGGCREALLLTRIAFAVLLPVLGAILGAILLVFLFFVLFTRHPALGLIPVGIVAALLALVAIRDRRQRERDIEDLRPR